MFQAFNKILHSTTKRIRFNRQLKALTFKQFRDQEASDEEAFKKLRAEIERRSCLANDVDQTDDGLCNILWKAIEGEPWALHAKTKDSIEFVFSKAVVGLSDSIHK